MTPTRSDGLKIFRATRGAFVGIGVFSFLVNLLMLTGPVYMLQIYDRVLSSGSVPTLVSLSIIVVVLYAFMALLDLVRQRILIKLGHKFDQEIAQTSYSAYVDAPMKLGPLGAKAQPIRDVDQLRQFLASPGVTALFDIPWMPIYIAVVFIIHPWLGWLSVVGAAILIATAIVTDRMSRQAVQKSSELAGQRSTIAEASRRNAEVIRGMGMMEGVSGVWGRVNRDFLAANARASEIVSTSLVLTKAFRLFLQSAILGLGAYLAIFGIITPGSMIAASIIMARALQPVEGAVSNWRSFLGARQAYQRLKKTLGVVEDEERMPLPPPARSLALENVAVVPPGSRAPVVMDVSLEMAAGKALGIIGRSGSGKSSLARALVGVWPTARGHVKLDDAPIEQWPPGALGRHVGYLPQDIELFQGTVAENIARFRDDASPEKVLAAATKAGVADLVHRLPDGFNTMIGEGGTTLSGGQRQRIALARALFDDPFLVVLDEPNSNLDQDGEKALGDAIRQVVDRGGIAVVIAHRPTAVANVDDILVLDNGRPAQFGPRDEVLAKVVKPRPNISLVSEKGEPAPA